MEATGPTRNTNDWAETDRWTGRSWASPDSESVSSTRPDRGSGWRCAEPDPTPSPTNFGATSSWNYFRKSSLSSGCLSRVNCKGKQNTIVNTGNVQVASVQRWGIGFALQSRVRIRVKGPINDLIRRLSAFRGVDRVVVVGEEERRNGTQNRASRLEPQRSFMPRPTPRSAPGGGAGLAPPTGLCHWPSRRFGPVPSPVGRGPSSSPSRTVSLPLGALICIRHLHTRQDLERRNAFCDPSTPPVAMATGGSGVFYLKLERIASEIQFNFFSSFDRVSFVHIVVLCRIDFSAYLSSNRICSLFSPNCAWFRCCFRFYRPRTCPFSWLT